MTDAKQYINGRFSLLLLELEKRSKLLGLSMRFRNLILFTLAFGLIFNSVVSGQETALFFKQNCSSCHWIGGGRLIGPDLKNVSSRQERDWLVRFMLDPKGMIDAGDSYALKLQAEAKGVIMIPAPGINAKLANTLLDFIEAESKLDSSQFAGKAVVVGPYSEADAAAGLEIFIGRTKLKNNGPPCITCHTVNSVGASMGGSFGPELTNVHERLQGTTALTAWLSAPPTSTMKSIFQNKPLEEDEVKFLTAYFESAINNYQYNFDTFIVWMFAIFCGLGGGVLGMVLCSAFWENRFRAVRRPLVNVSKIRGES